MRGGRGRTRVWDPGDLPADEGTEFDGSQIFRRGLREEGDGISAEEEKVAVELRFRAVTSFHQLSLNRGQIHVLSDQAPIPRAFLYDHGFNGRDCFRQII